MTVVRSTILIPVRGPAIFDSLIVLAHNVAGFEDVHAVADRPGGLLQGQASQLKVLAADCSSGLRGMVR